MNDQGEFELGTDVKDKKQLLYAGLTPELYARHSNTIHRANLRLVRVISAAAVILSLALLCSSFGLDSVRGVRRLYGLLLVAMVILALASRLKFMEKGARGTVLLYLMTFVVYAFGALLGGAIQVELNTVMFCVFLVVLPQIVTDYWWRAILPGIIMEVLFVVLVLQYTADKVQSVDMLNSISSLVVGIVLAHSHAQSSAKEYTLRDTLRGQRDTDVLTQLATRRAAEEQITQLLEYGGIPCAMILIDVDNFKAINDTYGHDGGDQVLAGVANRIKNTFRVTDLVCRLGGDEFLVFAKDVTSVSCVCNRAKALLQSLQQEDMLPGTGFRATLSVGIAFSPQDGESFSELYRNADAAMYQAKRGGKNNYAVFDAEKAKD